MPNRNPVYSPSGIFVPSTKKSFALGLLNEIGASLFATFCSATPPTSGPRKLRSLSICSRWIAAASSMPGIAPPEKRATHAPVTYSSKSPARSLTEENIVNRRRWAPASHSSLLFRSTASQATRVTYEAGARRSVCASTANIENDGPCGQLRDISIMGPTRIAAAAGLLRGATKKQGVSGPRPSIEPGSGWSNVPPSSVAVQNAHLLGGP